MLWAPSDSNLDHGYKELGPLQYQVGAMLSKFIAIDGGISSRRPVLEYVVVFLIFAGTFVFRVWPISKVHFWDEAVYLQNAEVICCHKTNYSELDSRPPLLSLMFAALFLVWHHVYAADIATALINTLGPVFLYFGGRYLVGRLGAGIAALLLGFGPFFVGVFPPWFESDNTGNSLLSDTPALTILTFSFWLLLLALRRQRVGRFVVIGFVFAMACLMRFACLSNVAALGLLILATERWWKNVLACAAGFVIGFGPYLLWSRIAYGGFFETMHRGWLYYQGDRQGPVYYAQSFGAMFGWITLAGLVLWIVRWMRERKTTDHIDIGLPPWLPYYLWIWLLLGIVTFFALRHQEPRYAMPWAPPLFLLAGSGLAWVTTSKYRAARIVGTVTVAAALLLTFLPDRERFESPFIDHSASEEMEVAEYLDENLPHDTVVYSNFNYPVFGYYSHLKVRELPEQGPKLYNALATLPKDGVLVAYTDPEIHGDPKPEWLAANPQFVRFKEFTTITLYWYRAR